MINNTPVIGVIDDDPFFIKALCHLFDSTEFDVVVIDENDDIDLAIDENNVDLILLDLNLRNHYGFEIAKQLRQRKNLGLIMLTGSGDQIDRLVGLEIGVDDYILKPFDNRELTARCRNVLRRVGTLKEPPPLGGNTFPDGSPDKIQVCKSLILDRVHFKLTGSVGRQVKLSPHEFTLFELFIEANGEAVSREKISNDIFKRGWSPLTRSVDVLVSKLRKKLNIAGEEVEIITIRGKGYKLVESL